MCDNVLIEPGLSRSWFDNDNAPQDGALRAAMEEIAEASYRAAPRSRPRVQGLVLNNAPAVQDGHVREGLEGPFAPRADIRACRMIRNPNRGRSHMLAARHAAQVTLSASNV